MIVLAMGQPLACRCNSGPAVVFLGYASDSWKSRSRTLEDRTILVYVGPSGHPRGGRHQSFGQTTLLYFLTACQTSGRHATDARRLPAWDDVPEYASPDAGDVGSRRRSARSVAQIRSRLLGRV